MPVNKIYEILDKAYSLIERKNWVGTVILLLVIGFLLIRDDKKESDVYNRRLQEVRDSLCREDSRQARIEFNAKIAELERKNEEKDQKLINVLSKIKDASNVIIEDVKQKDEERTRLNKEITSKVMRNTQELHEVVKQKNLQQ